MNASHWINKLGLHPHPEGGFYRETYRASLHVQAHGGTRSASTAIYFLLESDQCSALHRIKSDEVWHFYAGAPLSIVLIHADGRTETKVIGDGAFQAVVPAGCWFGARVEQRNAYALAGCTVAPGFDFADFEIGTRTGLISRYPQHEDIIRALTHP